jgi:hypothetical protein
MAVRLNQPAFDYAQELITSGRFVYDERDDWSEHRPSTDEENEFIRLYGFAEYGNWHLGVNDAYAVDTKGRYEFPYGDFQNAHRCAILSAESRAGQYQHFDIERAVARLHGMLEVIEH